jgi:endonuclease YncB( thermonuclease family)
MMSRRGLRNAALILVAFTLIQYLSTGSVNWPAQAFNAVMGSLKEFADNPRAGWRLAADAMEPIGAAREGETAPKFDLTGRVVRVADGDTVSLLNEHNAQYKVRLFGIDTPEQDQPYGNAAKKMLLDLVGQKSVGVVVVTTDSYGRKVGTLYLDGVNINVAMVERGYAWWYQHFAPHEIKLAASEQHARQQRLGLWAEPNPVPPWEWRRGQRRSGDRK